MLVLGGIQIHRVVLSKIYEPGIVDGLAPYFSFLNRILHQLGIREYALEYFFGVDSSSDMFKADQSDNPASVLNKG